MGTGMDGRLLETPGQLAAAATSMVSNIGRKFVWLNAIRWPLGRNYRPCLADIVITLLRKEHQKQPHSRAFLLAS